MTAAQDQALADVVAAGTTTEVEMGAVCVEADKVATDAQVEAEKAAEDEFGAGFFQGYTDLKMRVASAYPE